MTFTTARNLLLALAATLGAPATFSQPADNLAPVATALGIAPPIRSLGRFDVLPTNDVASLAVSPDGRQLVFAAEFEGRNRLWLQDLQGGNARPLPGTEEGFYPFWSPDGQQIGFFGNDQLKRLELATGAIQVLVPLATWGAGGSWGPDGTILFATHGGFSIRQIAARDGSPAVGMAAAGLPGGFIGGPSGPDEFSHVHPHFLPDGKSYLFYVQGIAAVRGIYVARLDRPESRRLVDSEAAGVYSAGRLFYVSDGLLMAQPFNLQTLSLTAEPEAIAAGVPIGGRTAAALAASPDRVVYRTGAAGSLRQLTWYDRAGRVLGTVGEPFATGAGAPSISPDGSQVVANVLVGGLGDIWTMDLASGESRVVANFAGNDSYPIWSADGESVLFSSAHIHFYPMYRKALHETTEPERVFADTDLRHPMDWSRDGRYLIFRRNQPDLWALDVASGQEVSIAASSPPVRWPQISPDGRWIAYQSEASGQSEIHLHGPLELPASGRRSDPVSTAGGAWVRWRADGRELYYAAPDGTLMAVAIASDGRAFTAAPPVALFRAPMAGGPLNRSVAQQYMVAADGQGFLVLAAPAARSPVHLIGR